MRNRTFVLVLVLAALMLALSGCGGGGDDGAASGGEGAADGGEGGKKVVVELGEQNGSGENGTATLTSVDGGSTKVTIELENAAMAAQPAHIHPGSCDDLDPKPAHGLANVEGGNSETTVDAPLADLTGGDFAINVHKSEKDLETYVACGDIATGEGGATNSDGY